MKTMILSTRYIWGGVQYYALVGNVNKFAVRFSVVPQYDDRNDTVVAWHADGVNDSTRDQIAMLPYASSYNCSVLTAPEARHVISSDAHTVVDADAWGKLGRQTRTLALIGLRRYFNDYVTGTQYSHGIATPDIRPEWETAAQRRVYGQHAVASRAALGELVAQAISHSEDFTEYGEIVDHLRSMQARLAERAAHSIAVAMSEVGIDEANHPRLMDCGHFALAAEAVPIGGGRHDREEICAACSDDTVYCVDDGRIHWRSHVHYWESDEEYHLDEDEDDEDEDSEDDPDCRLDYHTNVMDFLEVDDSFESSASGDFHMGIELETECRYESVNGKVREVRRELGSDYLVGKYDGSVGENSIEWVTRPTSLAVHLDKLGGWTSCTGLRAWNAGSCGMHIHMDSRAFTALTLGKFLQFFNRRENMDFIRQIAGRHPGIDSQAQSYANWDLGERNTTDPIKALKGKGGNRYTMVNTSNLNPRESERLGLDANYGESNTVEIRLFRATLRKERLLAQIEFTHAVVMFCRVTGFRALSGKDFLKWLQGNPQYRALWSWYGIHKRHGTPKNSPADTSGKHDDEPAIAVTGAALAAELLRDPLPVEPEPVPAVDLTEEVASSWGRAMEPTTRLTLDQLINTAEQLDANREVRTYLFYPELDAAYASRTRAERILAESVTLLQRNVAEMYAEQLRVLREANADVNNDVPF